MKNKKIAIIGAGITGLSSGQILKDLGYDITIYEKNPYPGGLIACSNINGILFHKVGGHVFNTKNENVSKWFWQKADKTKFHQNKRNAKIYFKGMYLGYPIENNIYKFDEITIENIIDELLNIFCNEDERKMPDNFDDFLRTKFGNTLYNLYFNPYNKKIWKTDLKNIPLKWLKGKLPMPDIKDILLNNIIKKEETQMVHSAFWYPEENGSQYIANTLAKELNIKYNSNIDKIENKGNQWVINGNIYDLIIYTGDIRNLITTIDDALLSPLLKKSLNTLKANGTSNVLCEIDKNDFSWMYFPEDEYKIHRIIYTGNFSPKNNGDSHRNTCTIEYSGYMSKEEFEDEVKKLPGRPKIIAYNYEPNSYIIHLHDTEQIVAEVKNLLESKNFYLIGRFAEWKYYNMDNAIDASMKLANRLQRYS